MLFLEEIVFKIWYF